MYNSQLKIQLETAHFFIFRLTGNQRNVSKGQREYLTIVVGTMSNTLGAWKVNASQMNEMTALKMEWDAIISFKLKVMLNTGVDAAKQIVPHRAGGSINQYNLFRGQFIKIQVQKETNFCWSHGQKYKHLLIYYLDEGIRKHVL